MSLGEVVYTTVEIFFSVGVLLFLAGLIFSRSKKSKQASCKVFDQF